MKCKFSQVKARNLLLEYDATARNQNASNFTVIALLLVYLVMNSVTAVDVTTGASLSPVETPFIKLLKETPMHLSQRLMLWENQEAK